jgi:hypothetical protein
VTAQVMERNGQAFGDAYGLGPGQSSAVEAWIRRPKDQSEGQPEKQIPAARTEVDWHRLARSAVLVVPIVLVNGFAAYGQAMWAHANLTGGWPVAILFAAALESIALYLAAEAHAAMLSGDAALMRRAASYGAASLVGILNWLHWADVPGRQAEILGWVFAGFSMVSPWLWSIRSRSMRRDALREAGLIDPRAVRFAPVRWLLFPVRTFRAFRAAVGEGVVDPQEAWALAPAKTPAAPAPVEPAAVPVTVEVTPVSQPPAAAVAAPLITVPGPVAPPKAPARPTRQTRTTTGGPRAATDEDVLRVTRGVLAKKPSAGRVVVTRALAEEGYRPGDKTRLDRLISQARGEQQS